MLAAADDATRQRCVRALEAACAPTAGLGSLRLQDIASTVSLTRDLVNMRSLSAINAVLAALGKPAAKGLDVRALKESGFTFVELDGAGVQRVS